MTKERYNIGHNSIIVKFYLLITIIIILAWAPVLFVPFINDDIQILRYNTSKSLLTILKPFWSSDVSIYYWRPLGNIIHPLILLLCGFHPFPFRLVSLIFYILFILVFFYSELKLKMNIKIAALFAIIFSLLPSHELQVAWIAEQGEILLAIFLVLSFLFYCDAYEEEKVSTKKLIISALFFIASLLLKELAFTGIFIPVVAFFAKKNEHKITIKKVIKHAGIGLVALMLILLYRYFVIGGTPFSSPNFSGSRPIKWIINFFIYIPLSFLPPEALERIQFYSHHFIGITAIIILTIFFVFFVVRTFLKINSVKRNYIIAAILWYVIFVLPALFALMRWYVFIASIGLLWAIALIFEYYWDRLRFKKIFLVLISFLFIYLMIYNFSIMGKWVTVGNKFEIALASIKKYKPDIEADSILIWALPDKIERIPMMKLGVQQSIQWALNNNSEVDSPLRAELINNQSKIRFEKESDTSFVFYLTGGRFMPYNGMSKSIIKNENISFSEGAVYFKIKTYISKGVAKSIAKISLSKKLPNVKQFYFDGNRFVMIN